MKRRRQYIRQMRRCVEKVMTYEFHKRVPDDIQLWRAWICISFFFAADSVSGSCCFQNIQSFSSHFNILDVSARIIFIDSKWVMHGVQVNFERKIKQTAFGNVAMKLKATRCAQRRINYSHRFHINDPRLNDVRSVHCKMYMIRSSNWTNAKRIRRAPNQMSYVRV